MLESITRLFTGYVTFEVRGDTARFLNIASKSRMTLWGFKKNGDVLTANIKAGKYRALHPMKQRTGVHLHFVKKAGLPFLLRRLQRRPGICIGAVLFIVLYVFLYGGVWHVQVSGNEYLTDAQILRAAQEVGVFEGARRSSFDPVAASLKLSLAIEELSWVSVNTDGSMVTIEVKEADLKPKLANEEDPSNIIAEREGQIVAIEAESGMKEVRIGDTVYAGQILIAGSYSEMVRPYVEKPIPAKWYLVPARGSVRAETVREFQVEIPRQKQIETETEEKTNRYLLFFGIRIPMGLQKSPEGRYHSFQSVDMLQLLDQELPVGLYRERYAFYENETVQLSEEAWKEEARYKLRQIQKEALGDDSLILEETLNYEFRGDVCVLTCRCRVQEEIGVIEKILFEFNNE